MERLERDREQFGEAQKGFSGLEIGTSGKITLNRQLLDTLIWSRLHIWNARLQGPLHSNGACT
jgi:hypothetical protein